jgi:pSer/pThr/pTyr-binding forkhead associated (FHA) protein
MTNEEHEVATDTVDVDHLHQDDFEIDVHSPKSPVASLVVKRNGAETDIVFPISSPATAGRFDPAVGPIDVDLASLPEGSYVSRKHAKFFTEDGVWKVKDLGSSNGTFVLRDDFERVEEAELHDGIEVALGNARFIFHLTEA